MLRCFLMVKPFIIPSKKEAANNENRKEDYQHY